MKRNYEAPFIEELCSEEVLSEVLYDSTKDNTSGEGNWGEGDGEDEWSF